MGAGIPTYVRNDISDAAYQVESVNTETNEKRLNWLLESNREEIQKNNWLGAGYIHGDINTPDGITKILPSVDLRSLLAGGTFRIVT